MMARGVWQRAAIALAAFAAGAALWLFLGPAPSLTPRSGATLATPVYGLPLRIREGDSVRALDLEGHLARTGYRRVSGRAPQLGEYRVVHGGLRIGRRAFEHAAGSGPEGELFVRVSGERIVELRDGKGAELDRVRLEPERIGVFERESARWQDPVPLDRVPERLIEALLSVEDRRFLEHGGLDVRRIGGAALANARAGRVVQGGSTLTQQLARSLYLDRERSWLRKLREALLALRLERGHGKREILAAYVNEIYMGHRGGLPVHGLAAAARAWFGRELGELDLAEQALLVGMIQAPNRLASGRRPELARARRAAVLGDMQERGLISAKQAEAAASAALPAPTPGSRLDARYYLDWLRGELAAAGTTDALARGGARIDATLDARLQRAAEAAVRAGLESLEKSHPRLVKNGRRAEVALVALDAHSGDVLALVGGRDYAHSQFNRATQAQRQPGSAFKPIVALAALAEDDRWPPFTLASPLDDQPVELDTPRGPWRPRNYDGEFRGRVTLRTALEQSLNVPIARLGMALGARRIIETARALGIESPLDPVASLSLGVSELTPLELTHAYAVLASGGRLSTLRGFARVVGADGRELARRELQSEPVVDEAAVYLVTSALRGAVDHGTAARLRALGLRGEIAAKTGTTNDFRDAWLVGYTPELALGVWVGLDDGESLGASGAAAALPIFADFLLRTGLGSTGARFPLPPGVESVSVDLDTGLRAGFGCPGEPELFLAGTEPTESCGWFARLREPVRRSWWNFGRDADVSAPPRPAAALENPQTCRVRLGEIHSVRLPYGRAARQSPVDHAYRVEGVAGQPGQMRLIAPFPQRIEGPAQAVGPGPFDAVLEIELPAGTDGLLVELELASGKRCADSIRIP